MTGNPLLGEARSVRDTSLPPYAAEAPGDPTRGAEVYATYCSSCHGPDGRGGKKASSIVDGSYLALVSDQQLRTIVIVGRPELGAPDWRNNVPGQPMSAQEISDVVAWLAAQRPQFPGTNQTRTRPGGQPRGNYHESANDGLSRRAMLVKIGTVLQWHRRCDSGGADRAVSPVAGDARAERRISSLAVTRRARAVSCRPDPPGHVPQSRRRSGGMGRPPISPAGCETSMARISRSSPSIARTSDARCAGSRSRTFSCVRATAASITRMVRTRPGLRRAGCFSTSYKIEDGKLFIKAGEMPTTGSPTATIKSERDRHAPDRQSRRVARRAPAAWQRRSARQPSTRFPRDAQAGSMSSAALR